jgi:hypothetical protein
MDAPHLFFFGCSLALFMVYELEEVVLVGAWEKRNMAYFSTRNSKLTPYWAFVSTASFSGAAMFGGRCSRSWISTAKS